MAISPFPKGAIPFTASRTDLVLIDYSLGCMVRYWMPFF
jgi:hypothetical protein